MGSAKTSNFSIDHIMGFTSKGKRPSHPTANANIPSSNSINSTGDLCPKPESDCNSYPGSQRLEVPTSSYLWDTPHLSMLYDYRSNGYFGYASFNYYPLDFGLGSYKNGAGPHSQYGYLTEMGNPRKRSRMRTVFTENQAQKLEDLFSVTDYPSAEMRDELAVKAGLSAETVRVWYKNRRARRKRQAVCQGETSAHAKRARRDSPGNNGVFE